jgi:hypothetical protein
MPRTCPILPCICPFREFVLSSFPLAWTLRTIVCTICNFPAPHKNVSESNKIALAIIIDVNTTNSDILIAELCCGRDIHNLPNIPIFPMIPCPLWLGRAMYSFDQWAVSRSEEVISGPTLVGLTRSYTIVRVALEAVNCNGEVKGMN